MGVKQHGLGLNRTSAASHYSAFSEPQSPHLETGYNLTCTTSSLKTRAAPALLSVLAQAPGMVPGRE